MENTTLKTEKELIPKVGRSYGHAWNILKTAFLPLFLVSLVTGICTSPMSMMQEHREYSHIAISFLNIFGIAFYIFIAGPIKYGAHYVFLKAIRKDKFEVKEMFSGFKNYLNVVLAHLLTSALIGFGFIFLIIPGIVFACRLAFVPYLVMDKKLDPIKAVEESWRLTKGHGWTIFLMGLLAIPIVIAGILSLLFGVFISIIWIHAAFATIYYTVVKDKYEEIKTLEVTTE